MDTIIGVISPDIIRNFSQDELTRKKVCAEAACKMHNSTNAVSSLESKYSAYQNCRNLFLSNDEAIDKYCDVVESRKHKTPMWLCHARIILIVGLIYLALLIFSPWVMLSELHLN